MNRADSYSSAERRFIQPVRRVVSQTYAPLVRLLAALGVSPNAVSCVGPALGLAFVWLVRRDLRLSFGVWTLSVLVDGVDGALARYLGCESEFGALVDALADHTREALIVVGLTASGALAPLWGSLYPFVYAMFNVTLFLANRNGVPAPWAIKSWMVLYPGIALYLLSGHNLLDIATSASIALMVLVIAPELFRLSQRMGRRA